MSAYVGLNGITNTIQNFITSGVSVASGSVTNKLSSCFYQMSGSGTTFSLPAANTLFAGWNITIKNTSAGVVTIAAPANSLDGQTNLILNPYDSVRIICDGTAVYNVLSKYTFTAVKRLFTFGATDIFDGQPAFARSNLLSSTSALNFTDNDAAFLQVRIPQDYAANTSMSFTIEYAPNNTNAGNFTWYLYWAVLSGTNLVQTAPTPPTISLNNWTGLTTTQASNAIVNSRQTLTFTIPATLNGVTLSAQNTMLMKLINTASPAATNPLVLTASCNYFQYIGWGY